MTSVKQICLGVAVAGVVAGAGSVAAATVAYADSGSTDSPSSAGGTESPSTGPAKEKEQERTDTTSGDAEKNGTETGEDDTKPAGTGTSDTEDSDDATADSDAETADETDADADDENEADADADADAEATGASTAGQHTTTVVVDTDTDDSAPADSDTDPVSDPGDGDTAPLAALTLSTMAASSTANKQFATATAIAAAEAEIVDPSTQHVLVIGIDGTNLSKILDDLTNTNFFGFMGTATNSASTIVGHTTISNPSWTTILTGVWDSKSGVINNIFTPSTYNTWPTVFNQLESAYGNGILTKAIADWDVITDIAGAGSHPADLIKYIEQISGDSDWSHTDGAVTTETVKSILGVDQGYEDVPNFLFSYLVQVDEAGHAYGGDSTQYADAISRTNINIGLILAAVAAREAATNEDWTVIMVTDHGHQPQQGFGHGFQSPRETSTFVFVDGPGFGDGKMNLKYSIADITPTIVTLFGLSPTVDADGASLTTLGDSDVTPTDLQQALDDAIDMYGWPDIATNITLSVRTIFASIPYFLLQGLDTVNAGLQSVVDQDIFLISSLAWLAQGPVKFIGDSLYTVTDIIAQIVGRLTGAGVIPPSSPALQQFRLGDSAQALTCPSGTGLALCTVDGDTIAI